VWIRTAPQERRGVLSSRKLQGPHPGGYVRQRPGGFARLQWFTSGIASKWNRIREELHWLYSKVLENETLGEPRSPAIERTLRNEIRAREQAVADLARQAQLHRAHPGPMNGAAGISVDG